MKSTSNTPALLFSSLVALLTAGCFPSVADTLATTEEALDSSAQLAQPLTPVTQVTQLFSGGSSTFAPKIRRNSVGLGLSRVFDHPHLSQQYIALQAKFSQACRLDDEAVFHLPPPFQSLPAPCKASVDEMRAHREQWAFFQYIRSCQEIPVGHPLPPEPVTGLTPDAQQALRKLARDERVAMYLSHLAYRERCKLSPE